MPTKKKYERDDAGKPQSYYAENRAGNYALSEATGPHPRSNWATETIPEEAERTRKMQQKDLSDSQLRGVAGVANPPSYKTGGIVQKTGLAMVHEGERIIPNPGTSRNVADHGEAVTAHRVISDGGWLVCPENAGQYTGENKPWRR